MVKYIETHITELTAYKFREKVDEEVDDEVKIDFEDDV